MFALFWRTLARPPAVLRRVRIVAATHRAAGSLPPSVHVEARTRELLDVGFALAHGGTPRSAYGGPFCDLWGPSSHEPGLQAALAALLGCRLDTGALLVDFEFTGGAGTGLPAGLAWTDAAGEDGSRIARRGLPTMIVAATEELARDHPSIAHHLRPGLQAHLELQEAARSGWARCRCGQPPLRCATFAGGQRLAAGQVFYRCSASPPCAYVLPVVNPDGTPVLAAGRQRPHGPPARR